MPNIKELIQNLFVEKDFTQIISPKTKNGNVDMSHSLYAKEIHQHFYNAGEKDLIYDYDYKISLKNCSVLQMGIERPFPIPMITSRKKLVNNLVLELKERNWIHVYGGFWTGKTNLLYLLSEKVLDYKWINLDIINEDNIIVGLKICLQFITNKPAKSTQEIIDNFVNEIPQQSVIFIDGIQTGDINSKEFLAFFGELYNKCVGNNIKIVTSGYCDFSNQISDYICKKNFHSEEISQLSIEEIEELFDLYGAPKNSKVKSISRLLETYAGSTPGLVAEVIKDIKEAEWKIDDKFWDKIFSTDIGSLEGLLEQLLVTKLSEDERLLLYRISYVGHDIQENIISELARISPKIKDFGKIKNHLFSRWLQRNCDVVKINKIYRKISEKNLTSDEKMQINEIMVVYYKELESINQFDLINLIMHLIQLKRFDEVGWLYVKALSTMIEENILDDQFGISKFWNELPLPSQMSIEVKVLVRMQQVRYLSLVNQDCSVVINDLMNIVNETHIGGEFVLLLMVMSKMDYFVVSLCMETAIRNDLWGDCKIALMNMLENTIDWKYEEMDIFDISLIIYSLSIKSLEQLEVYTKHLKVLNLYDINKVVCNNYNLFLNVWESVRRNSLDYPKLDNILSELLEWTNKNNLELIAVQIYITKMRLQFENMNNYYETMNLYNNALAVINSNLTYLIIDAMAKINVDNYNIEKDIYLITKAYETMENHKDNIYSNIYTCLNYMDYSSINRSKLEAADKMLEIGKQLDDEQGDISIYYRVVGEFYVNAYLCGEFKSYFKGFYDYIIKLLRSDINFKRNIIVCITHIVGYIVPDIVSNRPPEKIENGESYKPPARKMLINLNESETLASLYCVTKESQMLLLISELAYYYGEMEIAKNIIVDLLNEEKMINNITSRMLYKNSYLTFMLIENHQFNQYCELVKIFFLQQEPNETTVLRLIIFISLYVSYDSKKRGMAFVEIDFIRLLLNYDGDILTKSYFHEFGKILEVFNNEDGDYKILTWCGEKASKTDKSNLCSAINILMLARTKNNGLIIFEVNKTLEKLYMSDDVFVKRLMETFV